MVNLIDTKMAKVFTTEEMDAQLQDWADPATAAELNAEWFVAFKAADANDNMLIGRDEIYKYCAEQEKIQLARYGKTV
jgi:hypothetical protein